MPLPASIQGDWRSCGLRLISWATYRSPRPIRAEPRPSRKHWVLHLLLAGHSDFQVPPVSLDLIAPMGILLRPDAGFLQSLDPVEGRLWLTTADFEVLTLPGWRDPLLSLIQPAVVPLSTPAPFLALAEQAAACSGHSGDARLRGRGILDSILTEFLLLGFAEDHLHCRAGWPPRWLEDLRATLARRFADPDLDLAAIARLAGVQGPWLCHQFKRHFGLPPMAWLRRERLTNACRLLRHGDAIPIAEVARACGYRSLSLFSRHFRATFGCTARDWRQAVGQQPVP